MRTVIDFTREIVHDMPVFPGDEPIILRQNRFFDKDGFNNFSISMGLHVGTHIDGPMHMSDLKYYISQAPLEELMGEAAVLNVAGEHRIDFKDSFEDQVKPGQIVVLHTGHGQTWGTEFYYNNYPVLTERMAEFLVRKKIKAVCLDGPSPDAYPFDFHKLFFKEGIFIVENLVNTQLALERNKMDIFIVPLKIRADGAPARVFGLVE